MIRRVKEWFARPGAQQVFYALGLWLILVPGALILLWRDRFPAWFPKAPLVIGLVVLAAFLYLRRHENAYEELLLLGMGWAVLTFLFHLVFSYYGLARSWTATLQEYRHSGDKVWPAFLGVIFMGPFVVGLLVAGAVGVLTFFRWLRTTRKGMIITVFSWFFLAKLVDWYISETKGSWIGRPKLKIENGPLGYSGDVGLISAGLIFLLVLFVVLLPVDAFQKTAWRAYWQRVKAILYRTIAVPGAVIFGLGLDSSRLGEWLKLVAPFPKLELILDLGFLGSFKGGQATLFLLLTALGFWSLWEPLKD